MTSFTFDLPPYDPLDDLPQHQQPIEPTPTPTHSSPMPLIDDDSTTTKTITLRMPTDLLNRVDSLASQQDISRSQCMRRITSFVVDSIRNDPEAIEEYGDVAAHLYERAQELIYREQRVSVSLLQRHLNLDYHIALLLMDELERGGVVTAQDSDGNRTTKLQHLIRLAKAERESPSPVGKCWMDRKL